MREKSTSSDAEITINYLDDDYRKIVRPNQLFLIPNYFIYYWLQRLGPTLSWIVVSLQQAYWRSQGDHCTIAQTVIAEEIGIHRHTVAKELKENGWRPWHIPIIAYQRGVADENGVYHPLPNRYEIYDTPPLIPEHLAGLYSYLSDAIPNPTPTHVQQAISHLLNLKAREALGLLEEKAPQAGRTFEKPHAVRAVVSQVTGDTFESLPPADLQELKKYYSRLEMHLTDIGKTLCRQYFRQEWVPLLGPSLAWLVMIFRSRAYYNIETGELRDTGTWPKKELETLLGQSYRNIRNLLAHPYANHFIDLHSQRGRKVTLRVAMAEEPLTGESAGSFWRRQPHSLAEAREKWKNFDITSPESGNFSTSPSQESGKISTSPSRRSGKSSTPPLHKVEKTRHNVRPTGNFSTHDSTLNDLILNNVVEPDPKEQIKELLQQAGLSGPGLIRLCNREPGLELGQVKAVILYAEANSLTPGYIYRHLESDHPVDERFLAFADLDEFTLALFHKAVGELNTSGTFWPTLQTPIPADKIELFVGFAQAFTAFDESTILGALSQSQAEVSSVLFDLAEPEEADELETIWSQVLEQVQLQMPRSTFDSWVKDTRLVAREGERFVIAAKDHLAKEWLESRLSLPLRRALVDVLREDEGQASAPPELYFVVEAR